METTASGAKTQIETALKRTDLKPEQRAALEKGLAAVAKYAKNYRKLIAITQELAELIRPAGAGMGQRGGGGGGMRGGFGGGGQAEPGTYFVRLTVNGKTTTSRIVVRPDPIQAAAGR